MKRIVSIIMALMLLSSVSLSSFAYELENIKGNVGTIYVDGTRYDEDGTVLLDENNSVVVPRADLYRVRNKQFINKTNEIHQAYITGSWGEVSQYTLSETFSLSVSLSLEIAKEFFQTIKASGQFVSEVQREFSVGITYPADSTRDSRLAQTADFNRYSCEVWRIGYTQDEVLFETKVKDTIVQEPVDTYIRVVYKT